MSRKFLGPKGKVIDWTELPNPMSLTYENALITPSAKTLIRKRANSNPYTNFPIQYSNSFKNSAEVFPLMNAGMGSIVKYDSRNDRFLLVEALNRVGEEKNPETKELPTPSIGVIPKLEEIDLEINQMKQAIKSLIERKLVFLPTLGINSTSSEIDLYLSQGIKIIQVDTPHGGMLAFADFINQLKKLNSNLIVFGGNICNYNQANWLLENTDIDGLKVGVGPGSVCTTRLIAGAGVSQFSAICDVAEARDEFEKKTAKHVWIIADGGIRYPRDLSLAICAGADFVMSGSIFAGTDETRSTDGKFKYFGQSSFEANTNRGFTLGNHRAAEGISANNVNPKGKASKVLDEFEGGLRSALSYAGCHTISEFQNSAILSHLNNDQESQPHFLKQGDQYKPILTQIQSMLQNISEILQTKT